MWWLLNVVAVAGLATVAEALTLRIELRDIAVRGAASAAGSADSQPDPAHRRASLFDRKSDLAARNASAAPADDVELGLRDAHDPASMSNPHADPQS